MENDLELLKVIWRMFSDLHVQIHAAPGLDVVIKNEMGDYVNCISVPNKYNMLFLSKTLQKKQDFIG